MQFVDIVGQKKIIQELVNVSQAQHLPHAISIVGKKGWGGLPLALALSQYLMCDHPTDDSCGKCPNCLMNSNYAHPDVSYSFPTIKLPKYKDNLSEYFIEEFREFIQQTPYDSVQKWLQFIQAENSQGNISADQCRKIMEFFTLKSYQGNKKIHIIWLPEYLGKEGNILLKLIEEPPADAFLIFVVEQEHLLLATIQSRVQKFNLKPLSADDIKLHLIEKKDIDSSKAHSIATLAMGDYEKALELINDLQNDAAPLAQELIKNVYQNNGMGILSWVDEVSKSGRETIKSLLQYIENVFEQALRIHYQITAIDQYNADEQIMLQIITSQEIHVDILAKIKKAIQNTHYAISRNAHPKTQLLNLNIELQYAIKNRVIAE